MYSKDVQTADLPSFPWRNLIVRIHNRKREGCPCFPRIRLESGDGTDPFDFENVSLTELNTALGWFLVWCKCKYMYIHPFKKFVLKYKVLAFLL